MCKSPQIYEGFMTEVQCALIGRAYKYWKLAAQNSGKVSEQLVNNMGSRSFMLQSVSNGAMYSVGSLEVVFFFFKVSVIGEK